MTVWISREVVLAIHEEQLAEHGGAAGLRDEGLLDSALMRPVNLSSYEEPDIAALAAAYAFGIARNHPFVDGNKRTSLVVAETFLVLNGSELDADDADVLRTWQSLADGSLSESGLSDWIRSRLNG
ncbi:death-on-curing protein [Agaricicola taiwanensis]|uniref:Death-on-curing protein n=1 Tax=Agaricicola taiwanensis TaxID=591372 RepID=A0A8J2YN39_9RHOB|nr:type II toxin-antitoxin system death-on-curing family toxin [Agaricicola taiwanensis]GGE55713.1 death-on-curing protein [Agaricicola taiwanensis]